jgi:hypothetical protein
MLQISAMLGANRRFFRRVAAAVKKIGIVRRSVWNVARMIWLV